MEVGGADPASEKPVDVVVVATQLLQALGALVNQPAEFTKNKYINVKRTMKAEVGRGSETWQKSTVY